MDTLYSLLLLLALAVGGLGTLLLIVFSIRRNNGRRLQKRMARVALLCGVIALLSGLLSASVHFVFGHGPKSAEPMSAGQFLMYHKAYWSAVGLAVLSYFGWRVADGISSDEV